MQPLVYQKKIGQVKNAKAVSDIKYHEGIGKAGTAVKDDIILSLTRIKDYWQYWSATM